MRLPAGPELTVPLSVLQKAGAMATVRAYPRPSPQAEVGPHVWWDRYVRSCIRLGQDHPATQAAFGRYLAARGMVPQRDDRPQPGARWKAWMRASGTEGLDNRSARRRLGTSQGH